MSDLSELENDLKGLRPARPSPVLFERIEEAMDEDRKVTAASAGKWSWRRFMEWSRGDSGDMDGQLVRARDDERPTQTRLRFGIGLAAAVAALLLLLVRINTDQTPNESKEIAKVSPASALPATPKLFESGPRASGGSGTQGAPFSDRFIPAGATQVVYNTRDEGLHFANGSQQPVRRLRYQTQETCQWRNPSTGASLRVSYPSEEVVLIPVSGQ
jgi:hypothetical protein